MLRETPVMDLDEKPAGEAALLEIRGLRTDFATDDGVVHAVDGVDITVDRGETLGVVGESGCGKTVTALSPDEMRSVRSKEIGIVFQEPMTSLNPVYTVGQQIAETVREHEGLGRRG